MKIGFTGTRHTIPPAQLTETIKRMFELKPTQFHYGMCIGADDQVYLDVYNCSSHISIIGHPPKYKNYWVDRVVDELRPRKDYLERNLDIVNECDILIACPEGREEILRSGTWATIRYARKINRPIIIVYYDGQIKKENFNKIVQRNLEEDFEFLRRHGE